jgi:hypothetical protein
VQFLSKAASITTAVVKQNVKTHNIKDSYLDRLPEIVYNKKQNKMHRSNNENLEERD